MVADGENGVNTRAAVSLVVEDYRSDPGIASKQKQVKV
jgi:hypothetical protein